MNSFIQTVTVLASALTVLADISIFIALIILFFAWTNNRHAQKILQKIGKHTLLITFLIALAGVCGSLFYSEIANFAPCELCWWQRIFLFPQVIVLGIAVWHKKVLTETYIKNIFLKITLLLSSIGALIALYHSYGTLVDSSVLPACAATGVSCAKIYFLEFGYVTIPTMSLTVFGLLIVVSLAGLMHKNK